MRTEVSRESCSIVNAIVPIFSYPHMPLLSCEKLAHGTYRVACCLI